MTRILIAGASGFVGSFLSRQMLDQGHEVIGLGTSPGHVLEEAHDTFSWVQADTSEPGGWQDRIRTCDVVINLAGRTIFKPWTKAYKQAMYDSRVLTTQNLVAALPTDKPCHLLNASAVGFYGDRGDTLLSDIEDQGGPGPDFLAQVCKDWEAQALKAREKGSRVSIMRFGVILGPDGGALAVMGKAFKLFAGGPMGSGAQWFPWMHIQDLGRAVDHIIATGEEGIFNFTGPEPIQQKAFAKALGKALCRPAFMPAPAFMVKTVMGELGASLLQSQRAVPDHLRQKGFEFEFKTADQALAAIYGP